MNQESLSDWYRSIVSSRRRGLTACLARGGLALASVPYGLGIRTRNGGYDLGWRRVHRAAVPVVSVGNLTLGGTGKTPAVEWLAKQCRRLGRRVAILSRGYGGSAGPNDEALVLEENLPQVPHLQGPDRAALASLAVAELNSEVLLLDDGFQHRRLHRDLDIVLVDATEPWGHGWLFPRGLLREPASELRRAGLVLLTRCDQVSNQELTSLKRTIARRVPSVPVAESVHAAQRLINTSRVHPTNHDEGAGDDSQASLSLLHGTPVAAFCGLGNPAAFRETLLRHGAVVTTFCSYPDHHRYTQTDIDELRSWSARQPAGTMVVTTQKDLVKIRLPDLGGRPLWALQIALHVTAGRDVLNRLLMGVLQ